MNAFEKFLMSLDATMETPTPLGTFHLVTLALIILCTTLFCVFLRNVSDKRFRTVILLFWIALLVFELHKQITSSLQAEDGTAKWAYVWSHFPFQFCDMPFYLFPLVIFLKDGKIRDAAMAFLASYTLFAGLIVMICPETVFYYSVVGNVHTMFHHGTQIVLGIYIAVYNRKKFTIKTFLYSIPLFVAVVAIAQILNVIVHNYITEDYFNLFYISPYFHRSYPWVGAIGEKYHWSVITFGYIGGVTVLAFIIYSLQIGIFRLCCGKKREPNA